MNPQSPNFYENYDDHLDYGRDSRSSESEREQKADENVSDMISEPEITVVKIGGSTLGNHDTSLDDLVDLQKEGVKVVVVHGGGKVISEWMEKQGVRPRFVEGLRVTDGASLEIVVAVLTGLINKTLVSSINSRGEMQLVYPALMEGWLEPLSLILILDLSVQLMKLTLCLSKRRWTQDSFR